MKTTIFNNVYINDYYSIISNDEKINIKRYNKVIPDYYYGENSFEKAEIKMKRDSIQNLINNNHLSDRDIDALIGGDLNNQIVASSYPMKDFNISFLGIYSACSTFTQGLLLSSILIKSNDFKRAITSVSSHTLSSERQYRFPVEYGYSRPSTSTVTATGAISVLITNRESRIKITSATIGKVIDMGIKDTNYMGAVMAPACANTLYHHLHNLNKKVDDYDLILTGDLGSIGLNILKEYYYKTYHEKINNINDAGKILFMNNKKKYSGGSGPCCLPIVLFGNILNNKKYKHILLLGTGALHNTNLVNQKLSIPSICHAIELEVLL